MPFVQIWEQTAIISLYSINWLAVITETECVYCAVRTESFTLIRLILVFKGLSINTDVSERRGARSDVSVSASLFRQFRHLIVKKAIGLYLEFLHVNQSVRC
jgi:hypothetical protein